MKRISNLFIITLGVFLLPGKMHSMEHELPVEEGQPHEEPVAPVPLNPNEVLVWTAATSDIPGMELALREGADINTRQGRGSDNWTPLIYALDRQYLNGIRFLLDHGADMYGVDKSGNEAMSYLYNNLTERRWMEVIQLFLDRGFPINRQLKRRGDTLLTMATFRADCPRVAFLVERGANPFINNKENKNAFGMAVENGKCLQEFAPFKDVIKAKEGIKATKEFLKKYPILVNIVVDKEGNTLLHHAVFAEDTGWIIYLLSQGANADAANIRGETPVGLAAAKGKRLLNLFTKTAGTNEPATASTPAAAASSSSQK